MTHLLVTNDFPPKVGGIQAYLWELWSRLDPASFTVLTASSHPEAAAFDRAQADRGIRIERVAAPVLLPVPPHVRRMRSLAAETGASLVVIDPALPLGLAGPWLGRPYAVVLHGAEVTVPGRLPVARQTLATGCVAPAWSSAPAAIRRPRPDGPPRRWTCPWWRCRPVSTWTGSSAVRGRAGQGPGRVGPAARGPAGGEHQPAGAP